MIPMYRLWLHGLYKLHGPWCALSPKRPSHTHSFAITLDTCPLCTSQWYICIYFWKYPVITWLSWKPFKSVTAAYQASNKLASCGSSVYDGCCLLISPGKNGRRFADDTLRCIFMNEKFCMLIEISFKLVPKGPFDNNPALVQVMAWHRIGNKPLSEPVLTRFTEAYMRN